MPGNRYIVQQGDTLSKLAAAHGLATWRTIYDHDENADFRRRRPNPNLIFPGDELFIPELVERKENGSTEQNHAFKLSRQGLRLRIKLMAGDGKPMNGAEYRLIIAGRERRGTTGSDGLVDQPIPADAIEGELILIDDTASWKLLFGHLDPLRDGETGEPIVSGVQARLKNLGYPAGPADGVIGPLTTRAIARFQRQAMNREPADGILDSETLDALERAYGC